MKELLEGKKAYIIGAATAVYGLLGFFLGHLDVNQAAEFILGGSGLAALRAGIARK
jgi:hypothetical protein